MMRKVFIYTLLISIATGQKSDPRTVALAGATTTIADGIYAVCLLYTSPSPRDRTRSRMPSSA